MRNSLVFEIKFLVLTLSTIKDNLDFPTKIHQLEEFLLVEILYTPVNIFKLDDK